MDEGVVSLFSPICPKIRCHSNVPRAFEKRMSEESISVHSSICRSWKLGEDRSSVFCWVCLCVFEYLGLLIVLSHWPHVATQVATHFRANDVICSLLLRATQTCRHRCGQCERTRQQVEPQVRPLVFESFHTSNKLSNLCGNMCGNMWPVWKHYKAQTQQIHSKANEWGMSLSRFHGDTAVYLCRTPVYVVVGLWRTGELLFGRVYDSFVGVNPLFTTPWIGICSLPI